MTDRPEGSRDPEALGPTEPEPEPEVVEDDPALDTDEGIDDEDALDDEEALEAEPLADEELTPTEVRAEEAAVAAGATRAEARAETTSRRWLSRRGDRRAPTPSEIAVHVKEPWSQIFVIATVIVFALILLNALLLGRGGLITGDPTPRPSVSASAAPSASASAGPAASGSPAASVSASPATSASPSGASPAPSE